MTWLVVIGLAGGTLALRLLGPWLGRGGGDGRFARVVQLVPAAMVAALVVIGTFDGEGGLRVDARAAGVGAGVVALLLRAPMLVVVGVAAGTAAALRWFGLA